MHVSHNDAERSGNVYTSSAFPRAYHSFEARAFKPIKCRRQQ
jgi:hypothetical protein